jgi:hypothetical protein
MKLTSIGVLSGILLGVTLATIINTQSEQGKEIQQLRVDLRAQQVIDSILVLEVHAWQPQSEKGESQSDSVQAEQVFIFPEFVAVKLPFDSAVQYRHRESFDE